MTMFGRIVGVGLILGAAGAIAIVTVGSTPAYAGCGFVLTDAATGEGHYECTPNSSAAPAAQHPRGPDPCSVAQNAMRPCNTQQTGVDAKYVGTWKYPTANGFWVMQISGNGTYKFHSEADDGVAPNEGSFTGRNGHWALGASSGYTDNGSSMFWSADVWIARGQHGTAVWLRDLKN